MSDSLQYSMQMRDSDVGKPSRAQPTSTTSLIAALAVNGTISLCSEIPDVDLAATNISAVKKALADSAYSSMRLAQKRRGMEDSEFSIETHITLTNAGRIFVLAFITRNK